MHKLIVLICFAMYIQHNSVRAWGISTGKLKTHRIIVEYYNKTYFAKFNLYNTMFNRTARAVKISVESKRIVDKYWKVHTVAYIFLNNEYKRYPALWTTLYACDVVHAFGLEYMLKKCSLTGSCPIPKGVYDCPEMSPDSLILPPGIPPAQYKLVSTWTRFNDSIAQYSWHGAIIE